MSSDSYFGSIFNSQVSQKHGLEIGSVFGSLRIDAELGRGGMGVVYKAYDLNLKKDVALKIMHGKDEKSLKRFSYEARAMAKLDHPNIIKIYNVGDSPFPHIVMEYVDGMSLSDLIHKKRIKTIPLSNLIAKVCDALSEAHKNNILHRDIKPTNIMVTKRGEPKLMDFGLAKLDDQSVQLSQANETLGTPVYMSPEQLNGKATKNSDLYSIGATLYEGLTGRPPFQGENHFNLMFQITETEAAKPRELNPDVSPFLEAICMKCLEKREKKRYQDMRQLAKELRNFIKNRPIIAKPMSQTDYIKSFIKRNKKACILGLSIFFILVASSLMSFSFYLKEKGLTAKNNAINKKQKELLDRQDKMVAEKNAINQQQKELLDKQKQLVAEKSAINQRQKELLDKQEQLVAEKNQLIKEFIESMNQACIVEPSLLKDKHFMKPVAKMLKMSKEQGIQFSDIEEIEIFRGLVFYNNRDKETTKQGIDHFSKIISQSPSAEAYSNRGSFYEDIGENQKALQDYNKAIQLNPKFAAAYSNRGSFYEDRGEYKKAIQDYNKAIRLKPNFAEAYLNRGGFYEDREKYDKAIEDYSKAIKLEPTDPKLYVTRSNVYDYIGENQKAIQDCNKAIKLNPEEHNAYFNRGNVYSRLGKYKRAISDYSKVIKLSPNDAAAYSNRGNIFYRIKQYTEAIQDCDKAIQLDSKNIKSFLVRGNCYYNTRRFHQAIKDCDKAIQLDSKNGTAYLLRGLAKKGLKQNRDAKKDFQKAVKLDPSTVETLQRLGILNKK